MVKSAALVLVLLICGDAIVEGLDLPVPGAALGLLVLVTAFLARGGPDKASQELFDFAAPYFPLFFVPAAVGVIANLEVLVFAWLQIAAAITAGTAVTLLVTGQVAQRLMATGRKSART